MDMSRLKDFNGPSWCDNECAGDSDQICGGSVAMNFYTLQSPILILDPRPTQNRRMFKSGQRSILALK